MVLRFDHYDQENFIVKYLCSRKVPPAWKRVYAKLLAESGCSLRVLVDLSDEQQQCSDLCFRRIPANDR